MAKKDTTKKNFDEMKAEKLKVFESALALVNKKLPSESGDPVVAPMDFSGGAPKRVKTISSGSLVLDGLLGGGIARGRLVEIIGPEASGKTSIALTAVGNVQREGGTAVFIDLENTFDPVYAEKLGVNVPELAISQPDNAEQALDLVRNLADTGAVDIIVLDSIAALTSKAELAGDMSASTVGTVARLMSKLCRVLVKTANTNNCTVIFINQLREKIGVMFGSPETTPGGRAMKFYASQRIDVRRKGKYEVDGQLAGTEVKLKVIKNKIAPPFREDTTVLTFSDGIDRATEMLKIGIETGIISVKGRTYTETETEEKFATSKGDALQALREDVDLFDRLVNQFKKVQSGEETSVEKEVEEIEKIAEIDE